MLMKEYFLYCIQDGSFVFLPMKQIHMHTNKTVSTMKFGEIPHRLVDGTGKKPNRHTYINRLIQHLSKGLIFHKNTVFSCQLVREAGGAKKKAKNTLSRLLHYPTLQHKNKSRFSTEPLVTHCPQKALIPLRLCYCNGDFKYNHSAGDVYTHAHSYT